MKWFTLITFTSITIQRSPTKLTNATGNQPCFNREDSQVFIEHAPQNYDGNMHVPSGTVVCMQSEGIKQFTSHFSDPPDDEEGEGTNDMETEDAEEE